MNTDWIGPSIQSLDAARANVWRVQEARHAERFSERMSSTAYQRAAADMRSAGLNPILAAGGGMDASSPVGVPAQIQTSDIGGAISSAVAMKRLKQDMDVAKEQIENIKEDTSKKWAEKHEVSSRNLLNFYLAQKAEAEANQTRINSALSAYLLPKAKNLASAEKDVGPFAAYADRILQTIGLGTQAVPK